MSNTRLDTEGDLEKFIGSQGTHTSDSTETVLRKGKAAPFKTISGNHSIGQTCIKIGAPSQGRHLGAAGPQRVTAPFKFHH